MENRFGYDNYLIRRKILKLVGGSFHIFNPQGEVIFFSKLKAFKLKEDIRLYTGEDMQEEVLLIQARQIIDIAATYDVIDSASGEKLGALKRKGLKSILKDEWLIFDANDNEIGLIKEESLFVALIRRFVISLIPQTYHLYINGQVVGKFKQNFNPFVSKINVTFNEGQTAIDKRLGLAAGILLTAIEGKQK